MASGTHSGKTALWIAITAAVCLGVGFIAGMVSTTIRIRPDSQLSSIQVDLDHLVALNRSPSGFERVTQLTVRSKLLALVCGSFENLNTQEKSETKDFVLKYNSLIEVAGSGLLLPTIEMNSDPRQKYCQLSKATALTLGFVSR